MPVQEIYYLFSIFTANIFVGLVSWPLSSLVFGKLSDKGYSASHIIGWFAFSYIYFFLVTFKIINLTVFGLLLSLFIWVLINLVIQVWKRPIDLDDININQLFSIQISFFCLMIFLYWVRSHNTEIYQIERFMDFGFLQTLTNSATLPLENFWNAGEIVNYYYFSHFTAFSMLKLTSIPTIPGFFMVLVWIFGVLGINIYRFGFDLFKAISLEVFHSINNLHAKIAGFLALFLVQFAGTFHTFIWLKDYILYLLGKGVFPSYWYADATRYITDTITEMPIYGFLVADLHPHVWGLLIGVIAMTLALVIWIDKRYRFDFSNPLLYTLPIILGFAYMINSWDVLTLGSLLMGIALIKYYRDFFRDPIIALLFLIFIPVLAYGITVPWTAFYKAPLGGIDFVKNISNPKQWFAYWGPFLILIGIFFTASLRKYRKIIIHKEWDHALFFPLLVTLASAFFIILVEIIYFKDVLSEGQWYRANTVFKVSNQVWVWLGLILGPALVFIISKTKRKFEGALMMVFIWGVLSVQMVYPIKAIYQSHMVNQKFDGISDGVEWFEKKYPEDYEAYKFLDAIRKKLPPEDRMRYILEAEGDSFKDYNFYSTLLGWPTPQGWYSHVWTWLGSNETIEPRKQEVREVYTGNDRLKAVEILKKYKVNYIIVGALEEERYGGNLNIDRIRTFGDVVFENDRVFIVEVE